MRRPEQALHLAVAHMLDVVLDPDRTWWTSIDHGVGKLGWKEAGIRRARGVKPGIPDIILMPQDTPLIGIELKSATGYASEPQRLVAKAWLAMGHRCEMARSLEDVQDILDRYDVPVLRRMNFLGGGYERPERPAPSRHRRPKRQRKPKGHLPVVLPRAAQKV